MIRRTGVFSEFESGAALSSAQAGIRDDGIRECGSGDQRRWARPTYMSLLPLAGEDAGRQMRASLKRRLELALTPTLSRERERGRVVSVLRDKRAQAFAARLDFTYAIGLTGRPFNQTSKWQCGPVARPVEPTLAIVSPACTRAPASATSAELCA